MLDRLRVQCWLLVFPGNSTPVSLRTWIFNLNCRRQAVPAIVVAYCVTAIPILLTGTIGTRLRVPFSVLSRSSFGFWLSYFPVVTRGIIAMSWFGIQVEHFKFINDLSNSTRQIRRTMGLNVFIRCITRYELLKPSDYIPFRC
jgi:purine-cytosine permease-like protein